LSVPRRYTSLQKDHRTNNSRRLWRWDCEAKGANSRHDNISCNKWIDVAAICAATSDIELSPNICKSKATLLNDEPDDEPDAKPVMSYSTIEALAAPDLRNFLIDAKRIGVACTKYRDGKGNGWTFPPLAEAREAWTQLYGPQCWDNADAKDWGDQN
jgi:hypothetical protein